MPRLNAYGQAAMGVGDGVPSVDRVILDLRVIGGATQWLDDDTPFAQVLTGAPPTGYQLARWDGSSWNADPVTIGGSFIAAGGGRWQAWMPSGSYGSLSLPTGAGLSGGENTGVAAAGRDGTIAFVRDRQTGTGFVLAAPDGAETEVRQVIARDLHVVGPAQALWRDDAGRLSVVGLSVPAQAGPAIGARRAMVAGHPWIVYWTEAIGLVAHPWEDASLGYVLERQPIAFNHDAVGLPAKPPMGANPPPPRLRVAWSISQGESPGSLVVRDRIIGVDAMERLVPPVKPIEPIKPIKPSPLPIYPYYHPKEYSMSVNETGAIKGPGNKFGRVLASSLGTGPFGWYAVTFDRDTPDDDCWWTLTMPDGRYALTHTKVPCILGADLTEHSDTTPMSASLAVARAFYGKPSNQVRGILESPVLIYDPVSDLIVGYFTWPDKGIAIPSFAWVTK